MAIEIKRSTPYKGNVTVSRYDSEKTGIYDAQRIDVPAHVAHRSWTWLVQFNRGRECFISKGRFPNKPRPGFLTGYFYQQAVYRKETPWDEPEIAAGMLAGNWLKFSDFSWYGRDDDEARNDQAVHVALHTRDSGPLELSNSEGIQAELAKVDPEYVNWHMETHNHWDCGWVEKAILLPYKPGGHKLTPAWLRFCELQQRLSDYPVLDDDAYYQKVQDVTVDPWLAEIARTAEQFSSDELDFAGDVTPDQVYSFLHDQGYQYDTTDNDSWVQTYDDHSNILSDDSLAERVAIWIVWNKTQVNHD